MMDRQAILLALLAVAAAGTSIDASAQAGWPSRPVRLLVPAQPGGSTDTLARIAGQKLGDALGQTFVIDNRSGAGGTVAAETLMRAAPDGYTLGVAYTALTVNAVLQKVPYDTLRDFTPISLISTSPLVLVVGANSPVRTVKDLVQMAKAKPLSYGSAGIGSGGHVCGELLNLMAGIKAVHVPYKGAGPASADVAAGQIEFQFGAQITTQGLVKAGRLRMVAVTSAKRASTLPEVPTMAESGLPGFEFNNWFGVLGPAGMPAPLVARLNAELVKMMALPDVRERITFDGGEPAAGPPSEFRALLASDLSKWGKIARELRMQPN
jgi:tripartite-type tricarboxylate transporter receptor subunit TctC